MDNFNEYARKDQKYKDNKILSFFDKKTKKEEINRNIDRVTKIFGDKEAKRLKPVFDRIDSLDASEYDTFIKDNNISLVFAIEYPQLTAITINNHELYEYYYEAFKKLRNELNNILNNYYDVTKNDVYFFDNISKNKVEIQMEILYLLKKILINNDNSLILNMIFLYEFSESLDTEIEYVSNNIVFITNAKVDTDITHFQVNNAYRYYRNKR